ncbi:MAG: hypothetical protein CM15mP58_17290 [Burkholderiaceae bacterium]|nr:MAG: hypothetical protein CM15mP58_17290 [Burkholderiaceae bacterium]
MAEKGFAETSNFESGALQQTVLKAEILQSLPNRINFRVYQKRRS